MDHFIPKVRDRAQAYEWSNFRLASAKVNSRKGSLTVLDPFTVDDTWFTIDFGSSILKPLQTETQANKQNIQNTIDVLGLNDENWVKIRFAVLRSYARGNVSFAHLSEFYPFIARELERQGRKTSILGMVP